MITDINNIDDRDDPVQMLLDYQEIVGTIGLLLKELGQIAHFNESKIFHLIEQMITDTIPDIYGCAIFARKYETITNFINTNISIIEQDCSTEDLHFFDSVEIKNGMVWNYETDIPHFIQKETANKCAHMMTWMCELANDLNLYFYCVRNQKNKPFLSHEIDAINIFGRIVGSHLSALYSYEKLHFEIYKGITIK